MKLCKRAIEYLQIVDDYGTVRQCSWQCDGGFLGSLLEHDIDELFHNEQAKLIRKRHANQDFSNCNPDACPYVANDTVCEMEIEIDEVPRYPESIMLAYENVCNYQCIMCTVPGCLKNVDMKQREERLNIIDAKLRKILPYVKKLGANGMGEIFVSKHIMKLLSEWKPLADPSEIEVLIETNGSLFNEENWNKIANIGQYNLSVAITVLSFDPDVYQQMSGTTLPVENLISNLKFVKTLREKGIINNLEIATVVQEKNFRQMPEFAKRCIEDFGADSVRLRPYEPWTSNDTMDEWFKDIRNEYHPYNAEYLKVMSDPYLKNPKVHDWSGGKKSALGPGPYKKIRTRYAMIDEIVSGNTFEKKLREVATNKKIVVYGASTVGMVLIDTIKNDYELSYIIDRGKQQDKIKGISCFKLEELKEREKDVVVIIALERTEDAVKNLLMEYGYNEIYSVRELAQVNVE